MGRTTGIQWTDATHNFWSGCTKVSPGCAACYAERISRRFGRDFATVTRAPDTRFREPLGWIGPTWEGKRIFTCSMSDFFHEAADAWRADAWGIIRQTPHLTYQILTKRPERIADHLPADWGERGYPNVWLGVSAEYQRQAIERIPRLLRVPAAVHFVCGEPLLGPLDVTALPLYTPTHPHDPRADLNALTGLIAGPDEYLPGRAHIDWVIVGGESGGREARPTQLVWITDVLFACREARRACFVKQLGSVWAREHHARDWHGGDPAEWPSALRVREFPTVAPAAEARA